MSQAIFADASKNHPALWFHAVRKAGQQFQFNGHTVGFQKSGKPFRINDGKDFVLVTMTSNKVYLN